MPRNMKKQQQLKKQKDILRKQKKEMNSLKKKEGRKRICAIK